MLEKICLFKLKIVKYGKNMKIFGMWLIPSLGINFHSQPIYENKYLKAKVREFNGNIKKNFLGNNVPKEHTYYTCIACITLDSVLK